MDVWLKAFAAEFCLQKQSAIIQDIAKTPPEKHSGLTVRALRASKNASKD